jgi:hypothetical protein
LKADSFAEHFANHLLEEKKKDEGKEICRQAVREMIGSLEILWQGNPISSMKTFGKLHCTLCMQERLLILKLGKENKGKIINTRSEFFGGCRHRTRFHRYTMNGTQALMMETERSTGDNCGNMTEDDPKPVSPTCSEATYTGASAWKAPGFFMTPPPGDVSICHFLPPQLLL